VTSVGENEEKANTIQPPSCVILTFRLDGTFDTVSWFLSTRSRTKW